MNKIHRLKEMFQGQSYRGLVLAIIVLVILAITQVNHLQPRAATCELFSGGLKDSDLERIQLALGNAGLNDFQVSNGKLLVPQVDRAEYLQAVSRHDAIPTRLREQVADTESISMFMTHSQQKLVAAEKKKKQVRAMVMRLPFVEQVWFEMDVADSSSAFRSAQRTAVISIEPTDNVILDTTQIDTVKRIIQGAIAGSAPEQIQVIDIQSGYAHSSNAAATSVQGLPALEQQNYFENRIRRSLVGLDGVDVNVKVDVVKIPAPNVSAPVEVSALASRSTRPVPVTNGYASIYNVEKTASKVEQAAYVKPQPTFATRVAVDVAVPQSFVEQRAGCSFSSSPNIGRTEDANQELELAFGQVRAEITNRIQPLLPAASPVVGASPVNVRLIRSISHTPVTWVEQLRPLLVKYWPSIAVLSIGILLIASMTRNDRKRQQLMEQSEETGADILSINSVIEDRQTAATGHDDSLSTDSTVSEAERVARLDAEQKLNEMFAQDPGNAQKVIEKWIRDAA